MTPRGSTNRPSSRSSAQGKQPDSRSPVYDLIVRSLSFSQNTDTLPCGSELVSGFDEADLDQTNPALYSCLNGTGTATDLTSALMQFYLGGILKGHSLGQLALMDKKRLGKNKENQYPSAMKQDYYIDFLKYCSSYTPLMKGAKRTRTGGGYFLCLGGYGIVIDPGYQFLDKFYERNYSPSDINAVVVTHYHPDHYADLSALLALFHELYAKDKSRNPKKISVYLDKITRRMFRPLLPRPNQNDSHLDVNVLTGHTTADYSMPGAEGLTLRTLPTSHQVPGDGLDSGVGLDLEINKGENGTTRLIITGDTQWSDKGLASAYEKRRDVVDERTQVVLVVHMSTVDEREILERVLPLGDKEYYYKTHLALAGVCRAIETLRPSKVAISELGEEIYDYAPRICDILKSTYPCIDECVVASMALENPLKL